MALVVKNLPANAGAVLETRAPYSGWEDPLEEGMAIHSSILAWESDRGASTIHRVAQSRTKLKWLSMHACIIKKAYILVLS